jgi:hypothetical protein
MLHLVGGLPRQGGRMGSRAMTRVTARDSQKTNLIPACQFLKFMSVALPPMRQSRDPIASRAADATANGARGPKCVARRCALQIAQQGPSLAHRRLGPPQLSQHLGRM